MTREQATRARETLEDVFTPDGTAVVIVSVHRNGSATVEGIETVGSWKTGQARFPLEDLTAREDLTASG